MTGALTLVDVDESNCESLPCCGVKDVAHPGRIQKECWLRANFKKGVRAKVLLTPDGRQCGYIEAVPGEHAWRGVNAEGYLFIHCIFNFYKRYQRQGAAALMVQACVDDARKSGLKGVAVLAREGSWLAGPALYLASGFAVVDTAPPDYSLMVKKFDVAAADPTFRRGWETRLKRYGTGLTIIRSSQCPHIHKFADDIAEAAEREYGLTPRIVEIKTAKQAQNAPTPYAVFSVIYEGRVLADHQISRTRFRNIMRKLVRR